MTKRKLPRDVNTRAKRILEMATGEAAPVKDERNAHAVALGSLGGKARAKALSKTKRKKIAKAAARKRWGGSDGAPAPAR